MSVMMVENNIHLQYSSKYNTLPIQEKCCHLYGIYFKIYAICLERFIIQKLMMMITKNTIYDRETQLLSELLRLMFLNLKTIIHFCTRIIIGNCKYLIE